MLWPDRKTKRKSTGVRLELNADPQVRQTIAITGPVWTHPKRKPEGPKNDLLHNCDRPAAKIN